jgi:hypothetical protein
VRAIAAVLNFLALNDPHRESMVKTGAKTKRFNAGQDDSYLLEIPAG